MMPAKCANAAMCAARNHVVSCCAQNIPRASRGARVSWPRQADPPRGRGGLAQPGLERAGRVADCLKLAELMCTEALHRAESCGAHFREESQTPDGEPRRDDEHLANVAAWEFAGDRKPEVLHEEPLVFESVTLSKRSYV